MNYTVEYSKRKTIGIYIKDTNVVVRAPIGADKKIIEKYVFENEEWIRVHLERSLRKKNLYDLISKENAKEYKKAAREYFEARTKYYSEIMGIKYGRITITGAKTRFGSCSSKGNISYSYRLMLYPESAIDYVVVHELAHLVEMNHSRRFYAIIEKILPDYKERIKLLRK